MNHIKQALADFAVIETSTCLIIGYRDNSILTKSEMIYILQSRSISRTGLEIVEKNGVIELYDKRKVAREWFNSLSEDEQDLQIMYRYEDWYNDQQVAIGE